MSENEKIWYAAITRAKQEIIIRNFLSKNDITCYLPTYLQHKRYANYRLKHIEKPLIPNLIFIRASLLNIINILNEYGMKFSILRDKAQKPIHVPEKQMEDFIRITQTLKEKINTNPETFKPGDQVRVIEGPLAGVEGELIKIKGRHHLMLHIHQVITISIELPKKNVQKITFA